MFNGWKESKGSDLNFFQKSVCSVTAGFIGSIVGTPPDLILIRMQSDSTLPGNERRNYKSVGDVIAMGFYQELDLDMDIFLFGKFLDLEIFQFGNFWIWIFLDLDLIWILILYL